MRRIIAALAVLVAFAFVAAPAFADQSDAHYKRGVAFKRKGDTEKAVSELEQAVAKNDKHAQAWALLGNIYKQREDYPKAVEAYEKAAALLPKEAVLWSNLGMSYYRAQRADEALTALERACRLDPKNAEIHANLGAIRRQKGQAEKALVNLRWAVKLAPKEAPYHNNLGLAYRVAGSESQDEGKRGKYFAAAVDHFKKAIELDPNQPRYYFNIAVVYRRWEKVDDAIKYYELALQKEPDMVGAWYDLGHMHRLNHDNDKAIDAFSKYLELTGGKDPKADKEVEEAIEALGGTVPKKRKPKGK